MTLFVFLSGFLAGIGWRWRRQPRPQAPTQPPARRTADHFGGDTQRGDGDGGSYEL